MIMLLLVAGVAGSADQHAAGGHSQQCRGPDAVLGQGCCDGDCVLHRPACAAC